MHQGYEVDIYLDNSTYNLNVADFQAETSSYGVRDNLTLSSSGNFYTPGNSTLRWIPSGLYGGENSTNGDFFCCRQHFTFFKVQTLGACNTKIKLLPTQASNSHPSSSLPSDTLAKSHGVKLTHGVPDLAYRLSAFHRPWGILTHD